MALNDNKFNQDAFTRKMGATLKCEKKKSPVNH